MNAENGLKPFLKYKKIQKIKLCFEMNIKIKKASRNEALKEREGFEPSDPLRSLRISSPSQSTNSGISPTSGNLVNVFFVDKTLVKEQSIFIYLRKKVSILHHSQIGTSDS